MNIVNLGGWLLASPVLAMFGTYLTECGLGQFAARTPSNNEGRLPIVAILVPAHNEAAGLAPILAKIRQDMPADSALIVVADNCTDATAAIARSVGAAVIERTDPDRRGKGYALAFGVDHLRTSPPECVIIIDADCVPVPGAIRTLAALAVIEQRPVQAYYRMIAPIDSSPMVQISNFAFLVKNFVRQRGMARLGAPALLTGTGMAFPWALIAAVPLASGNIVEDLALGIHCAQHGVPPIFCAGAEVTSAAASAADTLTQRRRWEHGFLATARSYGLPLIGQGVWEGRWSLVWLGLHLLVPPLAMLFMIVALTLCVLATTAVFGFGSGPFVTVCAAMAVSAVLTLTTWWRFGRETLSAHALARVPLYILWKIPLYLGFVSRRETDWVRTARSED